MTRRRKRSCENKRPGVVAYAEYQAVVWPLTKHLPPETTPEARVAWIRRQWRWRLTGLKNYDVLSVSVSKRAFMCPVCFLFDEKFRYPCKLFICPFCWARKVANYAIRIQQAWQLQPEYQVLFYRRWTGHRFEDDSDIRLSPEGGLLDDNYERIFRERREELRCAIRRMRPYMRGGVSSVVVSPRLLPSPAASGVSGSWYAQQSVVMLAAQPFKCDVPPHARFEVVSNAYQLASYVGQTFTYPARWLFEPVWTLSDMYQGLEQVKLWSSFGDCR